MRIRFLIFCSQNWVVFCRDTIRINEGDALPGHIVDRQNPIQVPGIHGISQGALHRKRDRLAGASTTSRGKSEGTLGRNKWAKGEQKRDHRAKTKTIVHVG